MAGPWAAVWAAAIGGIYPETVHLSRYARFYTLQLTFGLVALYAAWRLLRDPAPAPPAPPGPALGRQWAWLAATTVAFGLATREQIVTLSTAAGFCALLALFGLADWRRLGGEAWRRSAPLQAATAGLVAAIAVVAVRPGLVSYLFWRAGAVPLWAELSAPGGGPITGYYRILSAHFPLAVSLIPLIWLLLLLRRPRLGVFLGVWFGLPVLLHSLVFPWKAERYILLAVPAFLLATAITAAWSTLALFAWLRDAARLRPLFAAGVVGIVGVTAWITQPAFNRTRREVHAPPIADWRASRAILQHDSTLRTLPWGNASPLPALFYWGKLDFTVQRALLESWERADTGKGTPGGFKRKPMGSPDVYAGVPVLTTPASLRAHFPGAPGVVVGFEEKYATFNNLSPELLDTLSAEGEELCQGRCGTIRLYLWRWKPGMPASD